MKLNTLTSFAHPLRRRGPQVAALGCLAFAVQVACSDAPTQGGPATTFPTSGTTSGGTATSTAGTATAAAGTFVTGGGGSFGTAGTGFEAGGTAGTTAGTASGGTAGSTAGAAGTGGTGVAPTPYCMGKPVEPLPFAVETKYYPSGWSEGPPPTGQISNPADLAFDACTARVAGAVGQCTKWRFTPLATPHAVWVIWEAPAAAPQNHVCLPEGANSIAFCARGVAGGEKIMTGGAGVAEAAITLTADWKAFTVPLAGVTYNTDVNGVPTGFVWKIDPPPATNVEFFIDKIQFLKDAPAADYCGGASSGEGGAGGAP